MADDAMLTFVEKLKATNDFRATGTAFSLVHLNQARSQPVFSGTPEGPFCLSCTFIFRNERNWMKKSARVSEKMVSPGLPGLQVATRLLSPVCCHSFSS